MNKTLAYYEKNAQDFVEGTVAVDFTATEDKFLALLPKQARILDFGCGSGRDSKYFLERGYRVKAMDGSAELCRYASEYTGLRVEQAYFQDLAELEAYDGIWACSSILHLPWEELVAVLGKMSKALKEQGIIYTSFKYGDFAGERNGRYFTDLNEDGIVRLLFPYPELYVENLWITGDVRPGRGDELWLNVLLKKHEGLMREAVKLFREELVEINKVARFP